MKLTESVLKKIIREELANESIFGKMGFANVTATDYLNSWLSLHIRTGDAPNSIQDNRDLKNVWDRFVQGINPTNVKFDIDISDQLKLYDIILQDIKGNNSYKAIQNLDQRTFGRWIHDKDNFKIALQAKMKQSENDEELRQGWHKINEIINKVTGILKIGFREEGENSKAKGYEFSALELISAIGYETEEINRDVYNRVVQELKKINEKYAQDFSNHVKHNMENPRFREEKKRFIADFINPSPSLELYKTILSWYNEEYEKKNKKLSESVLKRMIRQELKKIY